MKPQGLTQRETASRLQSGLRTVKRYWNHNEGATNPYKNIYKGVVAPSKTEDQK